MGIQELRQKQNILEKFEADLMRRQRPNYKANVRIVEGLYQQARMLGAFPLKDPLDGIEVDIRWAKAINVHSTH
jgi:hypothetical protein